MSFNGHPSGWRNHNERLRRKATVHEFGEKKGAVDTLWDDLRACDTESVRKRTGVPYDSASQTYEIECFGFAVTVDLKASSLRSDKPESNLVLGRFAYFSHLSILHYLVYAPGLPASGRFVSPADLTSGQIYCRGSHILPTAGLAASYGSAINDFRERGVRFGGAPLDFGDESVQLYPLPRIPVALVLWRGDEEFPPRVNFLIDAACEQQVASDIVWSVAMLSVLIMMPG